jgi:VanZ family protein
MLFNIGRYKRKPLPNKNGERKRSKRIIAGLAILTLVLSSIPRFHLEIFLDIEYNPALDMLEHGGYYFVLGVVLFLLFPKRRYIEVILFFLLFGSLIFEIAQLWIPGRDFTLLDIISNYIGIGLAFLVNMLIKYFKRKQRHASGEKTYKEIID